MDDVWFNPSSAWQHHSPWESLSWVFIVLRTINCHQDLLVCVVSAYSRQDARASIASRVRSGIITSDRFIVKWCRLLSHAFLVPAEELSKTPIFSIRDLWTLCDSIHQVRDNIIVLESRCQEYLSCRGRIVVKIYWFASSLHTRVKTRELES